MENSPEITEKFYKVFQEMSSKRKFTGIREKIGKTPSGDDKPKLHLTICYLCLKLLSEGAPSGPLPSQQNQS